MYSGARFEPTLLAIDRMEDQGIDINDAIYVVNNFRDSSWSGTKENTRWYRGDTSTGRPLKVLVEHRTESLVIIITVHDVSEGA